jgi:hypothetical protein
VSQIPPPLDSKESIQAEVEALTSVAKKLTAERKDAEALEAYKAASALMPGAPWLQNRTAELARKLNRPEVAALHYRRAATAFVGAGFPRRALGPLRTAWQLALALLPADTSPLIAVALELTSVQRDLGLTPDAKATLAATNQALKSSGSADRVPSAPPLERQPNPPATRHHSTQPPDSGVKPSGPAPHPAALFGRLSAAVKP